MMKPTRVFVILALFLVLGVAAAPLHAAENHLLFQTSTLPALMAGVYDGDLTFQELATHGDFGLGTFNALDGEMVCLDGVFYQIKVDGRVYPVPGTRKTPYAQVTFFRPDRTYMIEQPLNYRDLCGYIDKLLPSPNVPYAIRIEGFFPFVKTRSVARQQKPYSPLSAAAKHEAIFKLTNVKGVIVGFRHPVYMAGLNLPGYHCHFITSDRRAGGHLLDCRIAGATVAVEALPDFYLRLPGSQQFLQWHYSAGAQAEIEKVEK